MICVLCWYCQNSKGSVEVAAKCFYRRKDLPPNLLVAADRHARMWAACWVSVWADHLWHCDPSFFFLFSFALPLPFLLFFLSSLRPPPLSFFLLSSSHSFIVAVEEENELDISLPTRNNFDKLSELEAHIIRHRELFLSRQIETYKIDMVR